MSEYFITLSALIAVILLVRVLFRKNISPTVMYALWLVVVLRMCLPFSLFTLEVLPPSTNVPSLEAETNASAEGTDPFPDGQGSTPVETTPDLPGTTVTPGASTAPGTTVPVIPSVTEPFTQGDPITPIEPTPDTGVADPIEPDVPDVPTSVPLNLKKLAVTVWIAGACILALWFAVTGCIFHIRLRGKRTLYKKVHHTRVYLTEDASAPCVAGLIPSIYIRPETPQTGDAHAFIVLHEYMHLRHGDHIWTVVRILALIAHWWNPLVWAAAIVSKQDAELACDHAVAGKLKNEDRITYAHILLDTIPQKHRYAVGLGSSPMKERIMALTKKQKNRILCVVLAAVLAIGAVVGSFIALTEKPPQGDETVSGDTAPDGETEKSSLGDYVMLTIAPSGGMEVEDLPLSPYTRLTVSPVGYNPTVYVYNDDMTFYMVYSSTGEFTRYMSVLRLPDGYKNGYIAYAEGGAGSGELFLYVTAEKDGEDVLLAYYFLCDGSQPQPTEVILLTGEWADRIRENLTEKPTDAQILYMWRSVEGKREPYGLRYGAFSQLFYPIAGTFTSADYYADGGVRLNEVLNAYDESTHQMPVLAYIVREMEIPREQLVMFLEKAKIPYTEQIVDGLLTADIGTLNKLFLNPMAEYHDGRIYTTKLIYEMDEAGQEIPLSFQSIQRMAKNAKAFGEESTTPLPEEYAKMYTRLLTKKLGELSESDVQAEFDSYVTEYSTYPRTMTLFVGTDRFNEWLESTPPLTIDEDYNLTPRSIITMLKDLGVTKEEFELLSYIEYYGSLYDVEVMYEGTPEEIDSYFRSIPRWRELYPEREDLIFVKGLLLDAMPGYTNDVALREKYNSLPLTCWTFSDLAADGIYTKEEMRSLLESAVLYDTIGLQMTNLYDVDAIFAEAERNPVSVSGHWSLSDDSTREEILAYGAHCKEVIEKERTFYTPWYELERYEEEKVAVSVNYAGPFVGYVADAQTPWIELYTEKDGQYVGRIPYKIFDGWPATERDREGWTPGWQPEYLHFYFDRLGTFVWAGVHLTDTVAGSGRKNIATSANGGTTWYMRPYYETDFGGNHVTGMGFASNQIAFMSFDPQFEPVGTVAISRTTDGGKTWERMPIEVPEIISTNRLTPLVPRFDGLTGEYPILVQHAQNPERILYLVTEDGGMTWVWDETRPLSTYRLPYTGTWEAHYTVAATYDYDVSEMVAHCYYDPHAGNYVTEFYASSNKEVTVVLGVQNDRQPYGTFTDFKTYRVVRKANYVDSVTELPTITKEIVYREGKPFTGTLSGIYQSKLYGEQGLMNRRIIIEGNTLYVHVGLDATDAGGSYEGTFTYDEATGTFTVTFASETSWGSGAIDSDPVTVSGKLYEYGGYVHFLCEKSETYSLSADSLLPLTFRAEGAPLPDNSDMIGENQAGDWYSTYTDDYGNLQYVYRLTFEPESRKITFSSDYHFGEYRHVYEGTYTVDANYDVRATLREGTEEITMKFSFGYSQRALGTGGWKKIIAITIKKCDAERYKDLIGIRLIFEEELNSGVKSYTVDMPISDNGREYIACAAAYGDSFVGTAPYAGEIRAGADGTMYYVLGIGDSYRSSGYFKTYKTYRATSAGGYLTSVEETETFTKDAILKNGTPYKGTFFGEHTAYAAKAQSGHYGTVLRTYVLNLEENGKISLSSTVVGTGPAIRYEGMYTYDKGTGLFAASLTGRYSNEGEVTEYPVADVRGKLYEYGGFVHFVCEESGILVLSPDDPLPLTFVKSAALTAGKWEMYTPAFAQNSSVKYLKTAAYGESIFYADTAIHPYLTGVGYVTFGVITNTPGQFSRYYTYRVTSADGYITSAEETETFTGENVLKNGTPYKGSLDGEYRCETYNGDMLLYRYIKIDGDTISVSVSRSGTDGGGTYTGTYGYDETTGAFHADVRANGTGTPHSVTGRLHEYGGFVHFLCRSSTIGTISPDNPLPLTFVKPTSSQYRTAIWHTVPVYGGGDVTLRIPKEWEWDGNYFDEIGVRGEPYPDMKRVSIYTANISLAQWEDGLRNPEGPSRDYHMDSPITGTTDYGFAYTGYYGDGYADGDDELTRRYLFYIDTGEGGYVLEVWQRLAYDGDSREFLNEVVLPIVRSFCEAP